MVDKERTTEVIEEVSKLQNTLDLLKIEAIFKDKVKAYGTGAHVYIPKEYTGKEVLIIVKK